MHPLIRLLIAMSLLVVPARALHAQTIVDPSGHWEGKIEAPGMNIGFELDLAANGKGQLTGTASIPAQKLKGLPLLKVAVENQTIRFFVRTDQTFTADFFDNGKSMSGTFAVDGATLPFSLTRTGEAKTEPPLTSPAIGKELEGTWIASVEGRHVALKLSNQPDGTATGRVINVDQGGMEIPVAITQKASSVTFETTVMAGSFSGALNADGTELSGTWTEGSATVSLTFKRGVK